MAEEWVTAIAERTGTDPQRDMYPRLVAAVVRAVGDVAMDEYGISDPPVSFTSLLRKGFAAVAAGLLEPSPPTSTWRVAAAARSTALASKPTHGAPKHVGRNHDRNRCRHLRCRTQRPVGGGGVGPGGVRQVVLEQSPEPSAELKANGIVGQANRVLDLRGLYPGAQRDGRGRLSRMAGYIFAGMQAPAHRCCRQPDVQVC